MNEYLRPNEGKAAPRLYEKSNPAAEVEAKMSDRSFRDKVITAEEKRWYNPEKQHEIIVKETAELKKVVEGSASKIEEKAKGLADPLKDLKDLPSFLAECGVESKYVDALKRGIDGEPSLPPKIKHMAVALFEGINELNKSPSEAGKLMNMLPDKFKESRMKTFVEDETVLVMYLDRNGGGFYRSEEGIAFMRSKASEKQAGETVN